MLLYISHLIFIDSLCTPSILVYVNVGVIKPVSCFCSIKKVLLGVHSIKGKEKDSRQVRKVKEWFPHPCYDKTNNVNDLMLLKVR